MLFLIPARGGSKRLPGKNLKLLAGIPLVAHAIRRAQGAARILGGEHRIVVSTDSEEIADVAYAWGAEVLMRPSELATDAAVSEDVVLHAATQYVVQSLVLVQPTSPLATPEDVAAAPSTSTPPTTGTWRKPCSRRVRSRSSASRTRA
jgi:CMP-N,N'-diacetyllegionaminic acid synthase